MNQMGFNTGVDALYFNPNLANNSRGKVFTTGVQPNGNAYLWDSRNNRMLYNGPFTPEWDRLTQSLKAQGMVERWEGDQSKGQASQRQGGDTPSGQSAIVSNNGGGGYYGGGGGTPAPALDRAKLASLESYLATLDQDYNKAQAKFASVRDTSRREKENERVKQLAKRDSSLVENEQGLGGALNQGNLNTAKTLSEVASAMQIMGMAGEDSMRRSILSQANRKNREANLDYAKNARDVTSSFNEYDSGYKDDLMKINDQYNYDIGEANKNRAKQRQNTLYGMADVYNAANMSGERGNLMGQANSLNQVISQAPFTNPSYTGKAREMATPELADLSANIGTYTTQIGEQAGEGGGLGPQIKAVSVNNKDLGIKKRREGNIEYGV